MALDFLVVFVAMLDFFPTLESDFGSGVVSDGVGDGCLAMVFDLLAFGAAENSKREFEVSGEGVLLFGDLIGNALGWDEKKSLMASCFLGGILTRRVQW